MKVTVYTNLSGHNVLNKNFQKIKDIDNVEFIQPVDLVDPVLYLKPDSHVVEGNYLYFDGFPNYYEIRTVVPEHNRFRVVAHRDPLSTYLEEIMNLPDVILDRTSYDEKLANFYLTDDEIDILSFPYIETHPLNLVSGTPFSNDKNNYILTLTGGVTAASNNE